MNATETFEKFPCKMTARDFNQFCGIYKKLDFISGAGDLANNCYIRNTKSGFVLYTINGYMQPVYVQAGSIKKMIIKDMTTYIKTVLKSLSV